jgi:hypothetical protein
MTETRNYQLPLLAPSQAQKHVTVNEALLRLDALVWPLVQSAGALMPPVSAEDGESHVIGAGAGGDWSGRGGQIAVWLNGGWVYCQPHPGQRIRALGPARDLVFDGVSWHGDAVCVSPGGAASLSRIVEFDQVIAPGASSATIPAIPSHAAVTAVTARVVATVTGTGMASFSIGVSADPMRYGSGLGLGLNSWSRGMTGAPVTYYGDTPLILTPDAGAFLGGTLRLAIHLNEVVPPREA